MFRNILEGSGKTKENESNLVKAIMTQIAKFMGPTWGPPGSYRPQMGPMLAPWTLISGDTNGHMDWTV